MKCKYCNHDFKNDGALKCHERSCQKYYNIKDKIISDYNLLGSISKLREKYSLGSDTITKILGDNLRSPSKAAKESHRKYPNSFKHSDQTKQKIREKRIAYIKNNPEKTAWRLSNMSYPEKIFFSELSKNENYIIEREKSFFPYFADFTILNAKVVIEIDGSQHELEERKKSDIKKDTLIISLGYRVIRFKAIEVIKNLNGLIKKLDDFINSNVLIAKSDYVYECKKSYCSCGNIKHKNAKQCKKCCIFNSRKIKNRPDKDSLVRDVYLIGYVKTGKKYNVSDNTIKKWIKQLR